MSERLAKFGLELQAGKTRLIQIRAVPRSEAEEAGARQPETFDFLGFTHIRGVSRSGRFQVKRITVSKRIRNKLRELKARSSSAVI